MRPEEKQDRIKPDSKHASRAVFKEVIDMEFFDILGVILTYVALILTIISLVDYIVKNKQVLNEQN